jgi:hypothetical protein
MAQTERNRHHNFYILNIKLRKHNSTDDLTPKDYIRLLKTVYNKKIHKESSSGKHCIFKFMFEEKEKNDVQYLTGTLAQFTFIQNDKWFNLNSMDLDEAFKVPDGMFPDAVITDFVFVPKAHRFCFRVSSSITISPYPVKKFLEMALDEASLADEYVQVDVESDVSSIEKILASREIKKLIIDINYSNLDTGNDLKMFVEEDIKSSNTSRLKIEATQKPKISIDVEKSKILKGALEASISDGETTATIIDENNKVQTIKTSKFPRRESVYGNLVRFNQLAYEKIMSIFRPNGN